MRRSRSSVNRPATDEQRTTGRSTAVAVAATAEQARLVGAATSEQVTAVSAIVQRTGQMRKISQEVTKAVSEQGRAARDILKASQSTAKLSLEVRKATAEQAAATTQLTQGTESIRRGSVSTSRAVAEQAVAAKQIRKRPLISLSARFVESRHHGAGGRLRRAVQRSGFDARSVGSGGAGLRGAGADHERDVKGHTRDRTRHSSHQRGESFPVGGGGAGHGELAEIRRITERNTDGVRRTGSARPTFRRWLIALPGTSEILQRQRCAASQPLVGVSDVDRPGHSHNACRSDGRDVERLAGQRLRPLRVGRPRATAAGSGRAAVAGFAGRLVQRGHGLWHRTGPRVGISSMPDSLSSRGTLAVFDHMQQSVTIAPIIRKGIASGLIVTVEDVTGARDQARPRGSNRLP